MGYPEKRGDYYRARFKRPDGGYGTLTEKFATKAAARQAANDEEARIRSGRWTDPNAGQITFGDWANRWYAGLDLALSTMQNYKHHLEEHLLVEFEDRPLADISARDIDAWQSKERRSGYRPSSIKTWRSTLSTILADAVAEDLIDANPAAVRRGRGKRAGRSSRRGPEKVTTDALGALLIAERAALLAGRDDEFIIVLTMFYTGMRWAETVGLRPEYVRSRSIRIEQQLWEADDGVFHELPPKDDSYRDIDTPAFLCTLLAAQLRSTTQQPCPCHQHTYVFTGRSQSAHPRRSPFGDWIFEPAVSGWFPKKRASEQRRPVPLAAEPWPGRPLRGRNNQGRAEANWLPVATGLTPHGLRHSHKTTMVELRTPEVLSHERLGHELEGIGGRYSHVTPVMRRELLDGLTERWNDALDTRAADRPSSPVTILDRLIAARRHAREREAALKIISRSSPNREPGNQLGRSKEPLTWSG
ncbi:site-specific integrase [Jiangella muralis]|uniref:site-specific integrase n=1 Tax=Jiangella muralis TaxID=702383 RepID=UPI0009F9E29C|nr:site-specific integrase [Jiangella muralis]